MQRLPKRKGVSLGSITMLIVTGLVGLGCFWLFPKLVGQTDFQFDAQKLMVAFDETYTNFTADHDPQIVSALSMSTHLPDAVPTAPPALVTAPPTISFRLTAAGTVQIDSAVQKAMTNESGYRFSDLFSDVTEELHADLSIVTLENTVISTDKLTDTNVPADVLAALKSSGFSAVCFGYSGILNGGIQGLSATKDAARSAGMTPYGVYASQEERDALTFLNANGVSVALLSYQGELSGTGKKKASRDEQAFAIAPPTLPTIAADIQKAKAAGAQVVVVSLCWGKEGATSPTQTQRELAQGIADAGADIILGTHSNALQQVELLTAVRNGRNASQTLCAYSLGTFFSSNREKRLSISSILLHANVIYDLDKDTVTFDQLSYTPTYIWRGKKTDKNVYSVIASDLTPPDYVQGDQLDVMGRCLTLVQDVMQDSVLTPRTPGAIFRVSAD